MVVAAKNKKPALRIAQRGAFDLWFETNSGGCLFGLMRRPNALYVRHAAIHQVGRFGNRLPSVTVSDDVIILLVVSPAACVLLIPLRQFDTLALAFAARLVVIAGAL